LRTFIAARLRKRRDDDIMEAIQNLEAGDISDLVRRGVRLALNGVKQIEQIQKPQPKMLDWSHLK